MSHFYSRTTIDASAPTCGMPQQTTTNMFEQGYTHAAPKLSMPNSGSSLYTLGCNGQIYTNTNDNYQAPYTTVAYTDLIPLPNTSAGFWLNYANNNMMRYNTYNLLKHGDFGYETLPQFSFRSQLIETPQPSHVQILIISQLN
jgi:hypothetical protein